MGNETFYWDGLTGVRDITQLCCSPSLAGIVRHKTEQSLYIPIPE